ncbi:MAG: dihydrodipicolinate synthase family protein [Roseibacillus sp.]|jgi:dihydrodipicolinate synthase/N-acetylneuraminate lyase|nr:dihydrodipicolinate synthase family protein [Roseibacillus sp.]MCP4729806.1 dihydrodipicolinate synthase family protein [Roseibacillus sp.]MDP7307008.1 dihydrodipicolinate synthase family protein [Roseibacillus sp.]HJM64734.1 dihydrodipicolinate synthase family protein [Roseibacillus sp.]|tara:strand:+ start:14660 stop:15577 length:918 start_codon:yes stop_codon:yes gene_type:complete
MRTGPVTPDLLRASVIAVPPLARADDYSISVDENRKIIEHIEEGGVSTLLYGGNANLYHIRPDEYGCLLQVVAGAAGEDTLVIPSVGPAYGTMMNQALSLAESGFPTAMVLPMQGPTTSEGVVEGLSHFARAFKRPIVLYLRNPGYLEPEDAARLVEAGHVSFIKYAIVRDDPAEDSYLARLVEVVDPSIIVSGIGEQPAIIHREQFRLTGFTSGCVCVNPSLSQAMLEALNAGDLARAETIRSLFLPLEDLRNSIHPVRVLHEAIELTKIAHSGPHLPLLSQLNDTERATVGEAARTLLHLHLP